MGAQDRPQCFFDIEINRESVGRIIFQLFSDVCPRTCKNFLCLCTGEKGIGKTTRKKLCYEGSTFHRVVKNFMIQGGDFSEGNGKGGESIYGGYFKDENFILKHDRAFLLSMANRGKHTNGSQFFITTKPAPHLDNVHVVFGLVISGFEVIEQIENLKTDAASRPYADVRVINCGVLVTKSSKNVLEKKRKASPHSEALDTSSSSSSTSSDSLSDSDSDDERPRKRKRKRRTKTKQPKKQRREEKKKEEPKSKRTSGQRSRSEKNEASEKSVDSNAKRDKPVVRPEEIPPVPENRFLLRRDAPVAITEPEQKPVDAAAPALADQKPSVSKSGRKIRGRGTIRYHTPPHSRSCSESDNEESSETPPHWKEEMQRLRAYRPPSGEKWSKGDKLSDPGKWDERSLSQRSRSWSHNGFSGLSTKSIGHHKKHRKDKKAKHKKKAKKQKHLKKHKQIKKKRVSPSTEVNSSPSSTRRTKSPSVHGRVSRSSSLSSRDSSSRKDWSKSERGNQSSLSMSTRDSHSYYRSRSRSRSRSYSRRSSRSRVALKSSHSRSMSRSSSSSRRPRTVSSSPKNVTARINEHKAIKAEPARATLPQTDKVVIQPVVAESIPVIPLSDSPPPSRWKPGQKPWKPSYERIQEMKAKATHLIPTPTTYSLANTKQASSSSSYRKRRDTSDSDQSSYSKNRSDRSSESRRRSRSRTSRSRSYSRSYSRSRSLSSSRSRSRSTGRSRSVNKFPSDQSCYSGSSSYFSLSDNDRQKSKRKSESRERSVPLSKKRQSSSESTLSYVKEATSQKHRESASRSSLDFSTDNEQPAKPQLVQEKGQPQPKKANRKQNKSGSVGDWQEERSRSEWGSNGSKQKALKDKSESPKTGRKAKRKTHAGSKWDSGSNSERGENKNDKEGSRLSSKEEGEATSDSDSEPILANVKMKVDTSLGALKTSKQQLSPSDSENSCANSGTRGKSKKQKHGSKKNLKKAHSKKAKEKSKGKKEKKHKAQKRKETFHWQPPLEFGEEEEDEDITVKPASKDEKATAEAKEEKNQDRASENSKVVKEQPRDDEKLREEKTPSDEARGSQSPSLNKHSKDNREQSTSAPTRVPVKNVNVSGSPKANNENEADVTQMDDMEICTPDHYSPVKLDLDPLPVSLKVNLPAVKVSKNPDVPNNPEAESATEGHNAREAVSVKEERHRKEEKQSLSPTAATAAAESGLKTEVAENAQSSVVDNKWKPLQGVGNLQAAAAAVANQAEAKNAASSSESKPQGLRIEIKSKNKIRPGSLFDEVRKTARLNRRPRNRESSSEEDSPTREDSQSRSRSRSRSKSDPKSRHRTRSLSYSHSRSRSRSSTDSYRSRSYTRSRSRGWYSRGRSKSRSSSYDSYRSHSRTYSRSRSRSSSYDHHSRSRSYTYDSYYSRSRSRSRSKRSNSYHRSRSYDRRSRSCRSYGSDSESDRSYSNYRSPSESSRYS
uniref:NK-tumor recognition protein isoform X2 n=1 Tax=Euleptes europaea TaxID=460621 RepID=UPI0025405138|nr:NK-tumor recognition protein isoform X2 [Euleptes europaea]